MIIRKTARSEVRAELDQVIAEYPNSLLCLRVKTDSVIMNAQLVETHLKCNYSQVSTQIILSFCISSHSYLAIRITYLNTITLPGVNFSNSIS